MTKVDPLVFFLGIRGLKRDTSVTLFLFGIIVYGDITFNETPKPYFPSPSSPPDPSHYLPTRVPSVSGLPGVSVPSEKPLQVYVRAGRNCSLLSYLFYCLLLLLRLHWLILHRLMHGLILLPFLLPFVRVSGMYISSHCLVYFL